MNMKTLLIATSVIVAGLVAFAAYRVATANREEPAPEPVASVEPAASEEETAKPPLAGALKRNQWENDQEPVATTTMTEEQEFDQANRIQDSREADLKRAKRKINVIVDAVNKER
ncbi:hypothetical protein GC173_02390 [bacterium]|nr:hypothetical protein [bacterium]